MTVWAEDPELVATFRAEVEDRLASLQQGLLDLETAADPRRAVGPLFRDAHTVKGSARMLGLSDLLGVAHRLEDLLGAVREGQVGVDADLVGLMLRACDGVRAALPGSPEPPAAGTLAALEAELVVAARGSRGATALPVPTEVVAPEAREHATVRVAARRVDQLVDVVGEADLAARRLERAAGQVADEAAERAAAAAALRDVVRRSGTTLPSEVKDAVARLVGTAGSATGRELRELVTAHRSDLDQLRDGAMGLATVPVSRLLSGLGLVVREVGAVTGRAVRLETSGGEVEVDKQVLDALVEPLRHLVTNAVDHGVDDPERRAALGKPDVAVVRVDVRSTGASVVVEVSDDGAGIDEPAVRRRAVERGLLAADAAGTPLGDVALTTVLLAPGFSTASAVTTTSGRGVGLDVVGEAVARLGGTLDLRTATDRGTTFTLTLPVTLGVMRCLVARVGEERYAVPVGGVVESVALRGGSAVPVTEVAGAPVLLRHGLAVPLLDLGTALGAARRPGTTPVAAVLVRAVGGEGLVAWAVDGLDGESEMVVKDLGGFLGRLPGIAGATLDGDGRVLCLVDLREVGERSTAPVPAAAAAAAEPLGVPAGMGGDGARPRVLVVEDSVGVRELERSILESAGYEVVTAVDGSEGAKHLEGEPFDLVVSDVEMPGLDGFALTRAIRSTRGWENVPVVIMTSRGEDHARQAGLEAGCSAYLLKSEFDQDDLVATARRLVGR